MSAEVKSAEGTVNLCELKIAKKTVLKTNGLYRVQFLTNKIQYMASPIYLSYFAIYSDDSIKNTVLRPNRQYKASTAEMAEYRYS